MPQYRKLHVKSVDSQDINDMPDDFTRLLWVMLPLGLDSEGRGIYNAGWVKSKIFPLRDDVTPERVFIALKWLADRKMIVIYEVCDRHYFHVPTWHIYQGNTEKEAKSVIPTPTLQSAKRTRKARATPELVQSKSVSDADADADAQVDADADGANAPAQAQCPPEIPKGKSGKPKAEKLPREQDVLFNAIAKICCVDPATAGASIGNVKAALLKAKPPYSADEVLAYGELRAADPFWRDKGPPTLWQLKERIGIVRNGNGKESDATHKPDRQYTQADIESAERINARRAAERKAGRVSV